MKVALFDGKKISIENMTKPVLERNQVLLKIKNSGICGTDISIIKGHLPTPLPIVPGHEFSGVIESVGNNVDSDLIGKRVACEINANICGTCYFCRNNIPTNCMFRKAIGIDINGAFAEYIAVDEYLVHELPKNINYVYGTFMEPLAAAINTYELMPFFPSDNFVVIYGAGKMGQLIAQVTKQYHELFKHKVGKPPTVVVVSRGDHKLKIAKENGADIVINSSEINPVKEILDLTNGLGADITIEATGNPKVMDQVVKSTRTRGKIALKSTHGLPTPMDITDIVIREISLFGTRCGPFDKAKLFLASGLMNLDNLVSKQYPLSQIVEAFNYAQEDGVIKVVINNEE